MLFFLYENLLNHTGLQILTWLLSSNLLTEDQSEELKFFMRQLPALVLGLQRAGLMKVNEGKRKSVENTRIDVVNTAMHVSNVGLTNSRLEATPNDPSSGGNHIAPISSDREEKREVTDISKDISEVVEDPPEDHQNTRSSNEVVVTEEEGYVEVIGDRESTPR